MNEEVNKVNLAVRKYELETKTILTQQQEKNSGVSDVGDDEIGVVCICVCMYVYVYVCMNCICMHELYMYVCMYIYELYMYV